MYQICRVFIANTSKTIDRGKTTNIPAVFCVKVQLLCELKVLRLQSFATEKNRDSTAAIQISINRRRIWIST